jgi:hypothetical protein
MMWLVEYAHNDAPADGRKRRRFETFYLGVPDQALAWQIAERYIELVRQQHPCAALYAVRQIEDPWVQATIRGDALTRITACVMAGTRMGILAGVALAAGCLAVCFLVQ